MKLLVDIKGKYTNITNDIKDCLIKENIKDGLISINVLEKDAGLTLSNDLLEIEDLENNLEYIINTRNIKEELFDVLDSVKSALLGSEIILYYSNNEFIGEKENIYIRYNNNQEKILLNIISI